jgi:hypothetical protein
VSFGYGGTALQEALSFKVTKPECKARPKMRLLKWFCEIDDFWQVYEPIWRQGLLESGRNRLRACQMSMSEMMTLVVHFQQKRYRDFKTFYTEYVANNSETSFRLC